MEKRLGGPKAAGEEALLPNEWSFTAVCLQDEAPFAQVLGKLKNEVPRTEGMLKRSSTVWLAFNAQTLSLAHQATTKPQLDDGLNAHGCSNARL